MIIFVFGSQIHNVRFIRQKLDLLLRNATDIIEMRCMAGDLPIANCIRAAMRDKIAIHTKVNDALNGVTHVVIFRPDYQEAQTEDDMIAKCKANGTALRIVQFDKVHGKSP